MECGICLDEYLVQAVLELLEQEERAEPLVVGDSILSTFLAADAVVVLAAVVAVAALAEAAVSKILYDSKSEGPDFDRNRALFAFRSYPK